MVHREHSITLSFRSPKGVRDDRNYMCYPTAVGTIEAICAIRQLVHRKHPTMFWPSRGPEGLGTIELYTLSVYVWYIANSPFCYPFRSLKGARDDRIYPHVGQSLAPFEPRKTKNRAFGMYQLSPIYRIGPKYIANTLPFCSFPRPNGVRDDRNYISCPTTVGSPQTLYQ